MVYDVTDQESFDNVKMWVKEVYSTAGKNVNIFLLGNKSDLTADRVVSYKTAKVSYHCCVFKFNSSSYNKLAAFCLKIHKNLQSLTIQLPGIS